MSDKEFIDSIMEMFDVHEGNEHYSDEEFINIVKNLNKIISLSLSFNSFCFL